jgi:hypothetical protein
VRTMATSLGAQAAAAGSLSGWIPKVVAVGVFLIDRVARTARRKAAADQARTKSNVVALPTTSDQAVSQ